MRLHETIARVRNRGRWHLSNQLGCRVVEVRPKTPVISFTFDDFPKSAFQVGGEILENCGVRGTYYVSLGLMGAEIPAGRAFDAQDVLDAVDRGHELGCHTYAHCHAWETNPTTFESSILENMRAFARLVPQGIFQTHSYPIACPRPQTKRKASKHFLCCRGGGLTFNRGRTDANNLKAVFLEKCRHLEAVSQLIEECCQASGWLIFATHDVCRTPTRYGCTPEFFEEVVRIAKSSGAQVLPVASAWNSVQAQP